MPDDPKTQQLREIASIESSVRKEEDKLDAMLERVKGQESEVESQTAPVSSN